MTISRILVALAAISVTGTLAAGAAEPKADFFVAPNGNDAWTGRLAAPNRDRSDGPLASLVGARDAIRHLKKQGSLDRPVRVLVRGGLYRVEEPIVFQTQDSGRPEATILGALNIRATSIRPGKMAKRIPACRLRFSTADFSTSS